MCGASSTGSQLKKKRVERRGSTSRSRCDQSYLLAPPDDPEHECGWQGYAKSLEKKLAEVEQRLAQLERHRSEKLPPLERERRRNRDSEERLAEAKRKRQERALAKTKLVSETVELKVPDAARTCPHCKSTELRSVGDGKPSTVFEYVPGHFRRRIFRRETLSCRCGQYIVNAPPPERTTDKTQYGPGFIAHLIVSKCGDSIPLETQYHRLGIPISRSTMTDLFHRHAELLAPLPARLLERIRQSELVLGDETSIKMLGSTKRAYVWTFIADTLIAYRFSVDRSGETPQNVLGGTRGTLVVDGYTGYNKVTQVDGRRRAGCLAHARRKLFAAMEGDPEAQQALDLIRDVYAVEHKAKERDILGTAEHLALRQAESAPLMSKLHAWLELRQRLHPPKSKLGIAIRYALRQWDELTVFLDDPTVPLDNNRSEAALRVVALGRKNFLFVGNEDAGDNIAGLYSLVATCEANGVNPIEYLRDVLLRISTHPADRIDELLPDRWSPQD
jgi:transposase